MAKGIAAISESLKILPQTARIWASSEGPLTAFRYIEIQIKAKISTTKNRPRYWDILRRSMPSDVKRWAIASLRKLIIPTLALSDKTAVAVLTPLIVVWLSRKNGSEESWLDYFSTGSTRRF